VNELFDFVVKYTALYLWLARIEEALGKKEGRQENDLPELREEIAGAIVQSGTLGSEVGTQSEIV
jgi:hypothetical protein